jgi:hypothetical protein
MFRSKYINSEEKKTLRKYSYFCIAGGQMIPCCVELKKIKIPPCSRSYKCYFCNATSTSYPVINEHIWKKHPNFHNTFYKCDYVACLHLYFNSEEEKNKHTEEQHSSNSDGQKVVRCIYCEKVFMNSQYLGGHIEHTHPNSVIRYITYQKCYEEYLRSEQHYLL